MDRKLFIVCLLLVMGAADWGQSSGNEWNKSSNAAGKFSGRLPGTPAESTKTSRVGLVHRFGIKQPTRLFLVTYADFPESELKQAPSARLARSKRTF